MKIGVGDEEKFTKRRNRLQKKRTSCCTKQGGHKRRGKLISLPICPRSMVSWDVHSETLLEQCSTSTTSITIFPRASCCHCHHSNTLFLFTVVGQVFLFEFFISPLWFWNPRLRPVLFTRRTYVEFVDSTGLKKTGLSLNSQGLLLESD